MEYTMEYIRIAMYTKLLTIILIEIINIILY